MLLIVAACACLPDKNGDGVIGVGFAGTSNSQEPVDFDGDGIADRATYEWPVWSSSPMAPSPPSTRARRTAVETISEATFMASACPLGTWHNGRQQVERLLERGAEVLVLAFGTNDLRNYEVSR